VFIGFGLDADPTVKMMGVGMATAVLIDATVVRMVLVPATMSLLGRANWWLPSWLDRLLPRLGVDGHAPEASAEPQQVRPVGIGAEEIDRSGGSAERDLVRLG
jgi:RND superfamily putative drug exporter